MRLVHLAKDTYAVYVRVLATGKEVYLGTFCLQDIDIQGSSLPNQL